MFYLIFSSKFILHQCQNEAVKKMPLEKSTQYKLARPLANNNIGKKDHSTCDLRKKRKKKKICKNGQLLFIEHV